MEGIISILSAPFNLMIKLVETIKKYKTKKETEARFLSALEAEIDAYTNICDKIIDLSNNSVMPILKNIGNEFTPHDMNALLEAMTPIPLICAEWITSFFNLAKACDEVSALEGFMDYLRKSNIMLFDFVVTMKYTYVSSEKRIRIDGRYYRFFKTYEKDIFEKLRTRDIQKAADELEPYVKRLRRFAKRLGEMANKTALIKRQTRKAYLKNQQVFAKTANCVSIDTIAIPNMKDYLPQKLVPIAYLFEELIL
ncbi:MAG: hypothetical protein ACPLIG_04725 [Candidatus Bathyarchaeales archaeon]